MIYIIILCHILLRHIIIYIIYHITAHTIVSISYNIIVRLSHESAQFLFPKKGKKIHTWQVIITIILAE